jgi:uncharacterized protein YbaR (Trm112 family)/ubiquinone/menaquinone biosynthesis C-methylase UbiE
MHKRLLEVLACPQCQDGRDLLLQVTREEGDNVLAGGLTCRQCRREYPIADAVPNFLIGKHVKQVQDAFSTQWELRAKGRFEPQGVVFLAPHEHMVKNTEQALGRGVLKDPANRWILEVGCGSGDKVSLLARRNPDRQVVGMDFSTSVVRSSSQFRDVANLDFVRGDVNHPPFKQKSCKGIIAIGVLHCTENTAKAFSAMTKVVAPGGRFNIWIYPHASEGGAPWKAYYWTRDWVYLRMGHLLPAWFRYWSLRVLFLPVLLISPSKRPGTWGSELSRMDYYRGMVFSMFDNISPKYQYRHKQEEIVGWYHRNGFPHVDTPAIASPEIGLFTGEKGLSA